MGTVEREKIRMVLDSHPSLLSSAVKTLYEEFPGT